MSDREQPCPFDHQGMLDEIARLQADLAALRQQHQALEQAAKNLLHDLDTLIGESEGVCGLHLNGDDAPCDEIVDGGRFERLHLEPLRRLLHGAKGEPTP